MPAAPTKAATDVVNSPIMSWSRKLFDLLSTSTTQMRLMYTYVRVHVCFFKYIFLKRKKNQINSKRIIKREEALSVLTAFVPAQNNSRSEHLLQTLDSNCLEFVLLCVFEVYACEWRHARTAYRLWRERKRKKNPAEEEHTAQQARRHLHKKMRLGEYQVKM